jgi:hypothetical protein
LEDARRSSLIPFATSNYAFPMRSLRDVADGSHTFEHDRNHAAHQRRECDVRMPRQFGLDRRRAVRGESSAQLFVMQRRHTRRLAGLPRCRHRRGFVTACGCTPLGPDQAPLDGHETIVIEIDQRPGALHVLWSEHFEAFGVLVDRGSPPRFEPNSTCVLLPDHVHQLGLRELVHFAFADIQFQPLQKNSEFAGHLDAVLGQAILPVVFGGFYRSSPSDPRPILLAQLLKIRFKSAVHSSTFRSFIR